MLKASLAAALFTLATGAAAGDNIVKNPSFEAGAEEWDVHGGYLTQLLPAQAHSGTHAMITGCIGERCVDQQDSGFYFRQLLPTTPGQLYDLSFWTYSGFHEAQYSVYWNGQLVDLATLQLPGPQSLNHEYDSLLASSDLTMLEIHGRNDAAFIAFDDVSVTLVPEPRAWAMLLGGLALGGWTLRRRLRRAAR